MDYLTLTPRSDFTDLERFLLKECSPNTYSLCRALYSKRLPEHGQLPVKEKWFVELMHGAPLTYDTALPQLWLDYWAFTNYRLIAPGTDSSIHSAYDHVLFGTVWAYPNSYFGGLPFPLTRQAYELIKERYEDG